MAGWSKYTDHTKKVKKNIEGETGLSRTWCSNIKTRLLGRQPVMEDVQLTTNASVQEIIGIKKNKALKQQTGCVLIGPGHRDKSDNANGLAENFKDLKVKVGSPRLPIATPSKNIKNGCQKTNNRWRLCDKSEKAKKRR